MPRQYFYESHTFGTFQSGLEKRAEVTAAIIQETLLAQARVTNASTNKEDTEKNVCSNEDSVVLESETELDTPNPQLSERDRIIQKCLIDNDDLKNFDFKTCLLNKMKELASAEMDLHFYAESISTECGMSVVEVATLFNNLFIKHGVSQQGKVDIMNLIAKLFKTAKIPTYSKSAEFSIEKIVEPVKPYLEWHACPSGDLVYVDKYANDTTCKNCQRPRTHRCSVSFCASPQEAKKCSHYFSRTPYNVVLYKPLIGTIRELLKYDTFRTLIAYSNISNNIFGDLMNCSVAQQHLQEMNVKFDQHVASEGAKIRSIHRSKRTRLINKVVLCNGEEMIPINLLLSINFDGIQIFKRRSTSLVPLLLTILNLPPFLRGIVGVGMFTASFFNGGDGGKAKSKTLERFILNSCLINELQVLKDGILVRSPDYGGKSFYVQVRLILHLYDTRALEDVMKVQAANANAACAFCGLIFGGLYAQLNKVVYLGHRYNLPIAHVLRAIGQAKKCCPWNFHESYFSVDQRLPTGLPVVKPYIVEGWEENKRSRVLNFNDRFHLKSCFFSSDADVVKDLHLDILQMKDDNDDSWIWYHDDILNIKQFREFLEPHLYYFYADYRKEPDPNTRVTTDMYLQRGEAAFSSGKYAQGVRELSDFVRLSYFDLPSQVNWDPFHVLMNVSEDILHLLKNTRIISPSTIEYCEHFYFHPHLCSVIRKSLEKKVEAKSIVDHQEQSPPILDKSSKYGNKKRDIGSTSAPSEQERHADKTLQEPSKKKQQTKRPTNGKTKVISKSMDKVQKEMESAKPWEMSDVSQVLFDNCVAALHIPTGNKHLCEVKRPFKQTGLLGGIAKLQVFSLLGHLLVTVIHSIQPMYPKHYLYFLLMFTADIRLLLSDSISEEKQIHSLHNRLMELTSVAEGLWPHSELLFPYHQLTDLALFMKKFGSIKNWWTVSGERAAAKAKGNVTHGGPKYYKTAFENEIREEAANMDEVLGINIVDLLSGKVPNIINTNNKVLRDSPKWLRLSNQMDSLEYSDEFMHFDSDETACKAPFSPYEMEHLLDLLALYTEQNVFRISDYVSLTTSEKSSVGSLFRRSLFLRLHVMYLHDNHKNKSFYQWILMVAQQAMVADTPSKTHVNTYPDDDVELCEYFMQNDAWCPLAANFAVKLMNPSIFVSQGMTIGSIKYSGRGFHCREIEAPKHFFIEGGHSGYAPSKICNSLKKQWEEKVQKDSWCMYNEGSCQSFGQLNGFFRICCGDDLLDQLRFASVLRRKVSNFGFEGLLKLVSLYSAENTLKHSQPFIIVNDKRNKLCPAMHFPIKGESTNVSTMKQFKPYLSGLVNFDTEWEAELVCKDKNEVRFLCLLPLIV
jgi:hypothetical protein